MLPYRTPPGYASAWAGSLLRALIGTIVAIVVALPALAQPDPVANLELIELPPGFAIEVYASVPGARSLAVGSALDTLFVSTRGDTVWAVLDRDGDRIVEDAIPFARGLDVPNGIAMSGDGWLYVAERGRILGYRLAEFNPFNPAPPTVLYDAMPVYNQHGWRELALGPDDRLYVALGAPCNICESEEPQGTVARLERDGSGFEVFATGVRNSVGIAFQPSTDDLYFTNNGADRLGDDVPADTILHAPEAGLYFGFPFVASSGDDTVSPEFAGREPPQPITPAAAKIQAHSAPLGIHFYDGTMFPESWRNVAFVAEHGSWNRSEPVGYRVSWFRFDDDGALLEEGVFAEGWLQDQTAWGRPVDLTELSDGSLLISDDAAGVVYRVVYRGE